ncbi:MAG: flagellar biosynthetic protein FliO [Alphaproteobacteria bacterium]|nr:flagellar biosynthetic protein FliO [Alphaproteobacteria bacterium]
MINLMRYAAALLFVLALAGVALLVKRYGSNPQAFRDSFAGKLGKWDFKMPERRLAVVETLVLGPKQRLLIIRRDDVEHLVLSGPEGASIIEHNIPVKASQP